MSLTTVEVTTNEINSNKIGSLGLQQEEKEVSDWEKVAIQRRLEIEKAIPSTFIVPTNLLVRRNHVNLVQTCGLLTSREVSIVQMSAVTLLASIHTRAFTSVEVATAFCKSAAIAHQATNCLAWIMFEQCLADAAALDDYMRKHGKPKGPLHGLPISVKEHIYLSGTPATSGLISWANDISKSDALIVHILREAGAVFHVKTTNPQGLMALETVSNLYGTTTNPFNSSLTPGGSSGGEAALIAMRGSLLGIGTDIGGSIRAPSAFCGLYGLKPSVARLPHGGLSGLHSGMENIIGVVGPMATCIADLRLFSKVVLSAEPWLVEPPLVEIPWRESVNLSKSLKVGVMWHDGVVQPHPPITRCLQETVKALEEGGHTIVTWNPELHRDLINCINEAYFLDGGAEYTETFSAANEPATPLLDWLLKRGHPREYKVSETWKLNMLRNALQTAYAAQWNEAGIDVLLCPANASVASAHGESKYWGYTSVFNILDYSAAVFPVSAVGESDTWARYPRSSELPFTEEDTVYQKYYDDELGPQKYRDAPVSLQLVTRRFREEHLLLMLEMVMKDLQSTKISA